MRAISAALVLLSGVLMLATATAPTLPEQRSMYMALGGSVVGLIGFVCWLLAFVRAKDAA